MPLTPDVAKNLVNDAAWKDLRRILMMGLLGGASARAGVGVYGNINNNIKRKQRRDDDESPVPNEIIFPTRKAAAAPTSTGSPPRPGWFVPSAILGGTGAVYGGWAGVSKLMKAYRKMRTKQELDQAKQEFEDAMAQESQTKFGSDLDKLAAAWANGEIDEDLNKAAGLVDSISGPFKSIPPAYYTLAALSTLLGGAAGWKMMGRTDQETKLKAYREAARRRRVARPTSLVARSNVQSSTPQNDSTTQPEVKEPNSNDAKAASFQKQAVNWMSMLRRAGKGLGTATAGGIGGSMLMTKMPLGRRYLGGRAEDLMGDPEFVQGAVKSLANNPALMSSLYEQMLPAIKQQMVSKNPWMGRLAQHFA